MTALLSRMDAKLPVVAAPMAGGPSTPALVTAAAEAGALGFLAGGYRSPAQLAEQIAQVRAHTETFGVNLFVPNPLPVDPERFTGYARALGTWAQRYQLDWSTPEPQQDDDEWAAKLVLLIEDPVPVVSFTFGLPASGEIQRLRAAGTLTLQTVTSVEEAQQAAAAGVDGLIVQSQEAGGHWGTWTPAAPAPAITLLDLVAEVRAAVELPVWAAGGIATAAGVQEARTAGAEAAVVGTALLCSPESGAQPLHKSALADPARETTVLTSAFSGRPARALGNEFTEQFSRLAPLGFPALHHLTAPLRKAAAAAGDPEGLNLWAGTGYRHATAQPAGEILRRLAGQLPG